MDTLIERNICTNTRCYSCGALVYDVEKRKTANHIYHNRCFCCRICKRNLTASSLNEEGDDIYCTNCYRKKQRGDCHSLDFQRAASERGLYTYNQRNADQSPSDSTPRRPIQHDLSRHPSWTLRQLERQFLSLQEPKSTILEKTKENYHKISSLSHPINLKTSFSSPANLTKFRHHSSLSNVEPSPVLHFSPAYSPFPNSATERSPTPKQFNRIDITNHQSRSKMSSIGNIRSRLHQSNIDLTNDILLTDDEYNTRSNSKENTNKNRVTFRFPDVKNTSSRIRSPSVNNTINRRKIK